MSELPGDEVSVTAPPTPATATPMVPEKVVVGMTVKLPPMEPPLAPTAPMVHTMPGAVATQPLGSATVGASASPAGSVTVTVPSVLSVAPLWVMVTW